MSITETNDQSTTPVAPGEKRPTHMRLRRFLILITCLTALTPLAIMTAINYVQDTNAHRAEARYAISGILSNTKRAIESAIEERRSVLSLLNNERTYEELADDSRLDNTLRNLNSTFGGFVDIGLINSDGSQLFYSGPYELSEYNYKDQPWFHEVVLRGVYVSDVFMGHRDFPHFVIAFKHDLDEGGFYILRTTLDMELLNRQIYALDLDRMTDAFIVNKQGVIQTASSFYGDVLDTIDVAIPPHSRNREVIEEFRRNGKWVTLGYSHISQSPFLIMALTQQETPLVYWLYHRSGTIWMLLVSVVVILIVVFYSSNHMVELLRKADLRRAKLLHNIEYTNKMATLGRLAAGVAHEINNPLAIINEKAGLMADLANFTPDYPVKDKTLKMMESVTNSVERCSRVTHRLLGFARRMDIQKELIDLEALLKEVISFQDTEVSHRGIEVQFDVQDTVASIESDRGQLQQVFLNLLNNAFSAVADKGQVKITIIQPNTNEVTVVVSDNGSGIAKGDLQHVFEPFYSTKGTKGTGLGLSITREIVEKLGGLIEVRSEVGQGTSFSVNLPVEKAD